MANPVYQSVGTASNTAADTITVTAPSGIADNDILLASIFAQTQGQVITPPTGFASIARIENAGGFICMEAFWKRASGESGNYDFTETGNSWGGGAMIRVSGAITTGSPIDVVGADSIGSDSSAEALDVTTTVAETLLCYLCVNDSAFTATQPTGMLERSDSGGVYFATEAIASEGATGGRTATLSGSAQWMAVLVAIKPPAAAGGQSFVMFPPRTDGLGRGGIFPGNRVQ